MSVSVKAAALNHHDVWSLRGVGLPADRLPLTSSRDVTQTRMPACRASMVSAVETPPPAPWTRTVSPGRSAAGVNSIRYAVSQAVGRHAASAKLSSAGLATRFPAGTRTDWAIAPG